MSGEEHVRKMDTVLAMAAGQEHAWCVQGTAKRLVSVKLSEQKGEEGEEFLGPDPVMVSSESSVRSNLVWILISVILRILGGVHKWLHFV